jgi:hypothetical protein
VAGGAGLAVAGGAGLAVAGGAGLAVAIGLAGGTDCDAAGGDAAATAVPGVADFATAGFGVAGFGVAGFGVAGFGSAGSELTVGFRAAGGLVCAPPAGWAGRTAPATGSPAVRGSVASVVREASTRLESFTPV